MQAGPEESEGSMGKLRLKVAEQDSDTVATE